MPTKHTILSESKAGVRGHFQASIRAYRRRYSSTEDNIDRLKNFVFTAMKMFFKSKNAYFWGYVDAVKQPRGFPDSSGLPTRYSMQVTFNYKETSRSPQYISFSEQYSLDKAQSILEEEAVELVEEMLNDIEMV